MTRFILISVFTALLAMPTLVAAEPVPEAAQAMPEPLVEESGEMAFAPDMGAGEADATPMDGEPTDQELLESVVPVEADADMASGMPVEEVSAEVEMDGMELVAEPIELEAAPAAPVRTASGVVLGPQGVDGEGRTGRLHTVSRGDTLWDLAAAYLGTPWVWPSVWIDNDDIANPHRIDPGDKIWITANEMRVVTDAEAEAFVTAVPMEGAADESLAMDSDAFQDSGLEDEVPVAAFDDSASDLEMLPVTVPGMDAAMEDQGRRITVARRQAMGFVSAEEFEGASSIVGSATERTYLAAGDPAVIGLGEGDVEIGDEFTIFTTVEEVRDVETNRILGHHVEILGWIEVKELTGDTAIGEIRESYSEIERGTRVMARKEMPRTVEVRSTPEAAEGQIVFLPAERTVMADGGYVYLNRGEFHGVEVGSQLEVFEEGRIVEEVTRDVDVRTPDHVVARLVVVKVESDSAVAFVLSSDRELEVGDTVRPRMATLAQR